MPDMNLENVFANFMEAIYGSESAALDSIRASERLSASQQLAIYRGSVYGTLTRALTEIFPVVERCVGKVFFEAMASRFIDQVPPRSHSLDDIGEDFPEFVDNFEALSNYPYLGDVARLEWFWHRAFHAADDDALRAESLQRVPSDNYDELRFIPRHSLHCIRSEYPVLDIWRNNRPPYSDAEVDLLKGGQTIVLWREGYDVCVATVSETEWELIDAIKNGLSLGTICQQAESKRGTDIMLAALGKAIQYGWIAAYQLR